MTEPAELDPPEEEEDAEEGEAAEAKEEEFILPSKRRKLNARAQKGKAARERRIELESAATRLAQQASRPAWVDADDAELEVDLSAKLVRHKLRVSEKEEPVTGEEYVRRLRNEFVRFHGNVRWTQPPPAAEAPDSSDEEAAELAASSAKLVREGRGGALRPRELDIVRVKDVRLAPVGETRGPSSIQVLQFHPSSELLMTAGQDKTLRLFSADGEENEKVAAYHFQKFPIKYGSFTPDGDRVVLLGMRDLVRTLDVRTGDSRLLKPLATQPHTRFHNLAVGPNPADKAGLKSSSFFAMLGDAGATLVFDARSDHPVRTLRMGAEGVACVFSPEQDVLVTADKDCNLYRWDLGTGRCLEKVKEEWAVRITCLAMSRVTAQNPRSILAVGTNMGNVDLYDASEPRLSKKPFKSIDNLTTWVKVARYHPNGELLGMASSDKTTALRMAHMGSQTVFENWPTMTTPKQEVTAIDFSRRGGLMAIGSMEGRVHLYQLRHYQTAAA